MIVDTNLFPGIDPLPEEKFNEYKPEGKLR